MKLRLRLRVATTKKASFARVAGAERFGVAGLRVRQLKIGRKSCFGILPFLPLLTKGALVNEIVKIHNFRFYKKCES